MKKCKEVMTNNPVSCLPDDSVAKVAQLMRRDNIGSVLVIENEQTQMLVGIVTDRDLRRATNSPLVLRERWYDEFMLDRIPVRACMSESPTTVTPQTPIADAAKIMRDRKIGGLPVMQGDKLVGIVTETDLLNYLIRVLEP